MRKLILFSIFLALSLPTIAEPVGRVDSLHGDKKLLRKTGEKAPWLRSFLEQDAEIGHHFKTDANSMASIRFFLGGNVGLGKGCEVRIIDRGDAKVISQGLYLGKGNYWMKFDKDRIQQQGAPVRVQTAGGVMGIRGTEFVLQVEESGQTKLSLIEGAVEIEPEDGELFAARPGMRVSFGGSQGLVYNLYQVDEMLEQVEEEVGPAFVDLRESLVETRKALRDARYQVRVASAETRLALISARQGALEGEEALRDADLAGLGTDMSRIRDLLRQADGVIPPEQTRPVEARTSQVGGTPVLSPYPSLAWQNVESDLFAVMILHPTSDDRVYWIAETEGPSYQYPEDAEALAPGSYRCRVVPIDENGEPSGEAVDFPFRVDATP